MKPIETRGGREWGERVPLQADPGLIEPSGFVRPRFGSIFWPVFSAIIAAALVLTVIYGVGFVILMDQATAGPTVSEPAVAGPDDPFSWMGKSG